MPARFALPNGELARKPFVIRRVFRVESRVGSIVRMDSMCRFLPLLMVAAIVAVGFAAHAQELTAARGKIDSARIELDQIEAGVTTRTVSDSDYQAMRKRVDEIAQTVKAISDEQTPRADVIRSRLKELGPRPDEKSPPESAEITKERDDREKSLKEVEETVKLARALNVQSDQIVTAISDRRRALFTQALFTQSASILSPALWGEVAVNLGHDLRALAFMARDTYDRAVQTAGLLGGLLILFGLVATAAATVFARRNVLAMIERSTLFGNPTRLQRALRALAIGAIGFAIPAAGTYAIGEAIDGAAILPYRVEPVMIALLRGVVAVSFVRSLAEGLLAPRKPEWRLLSLPDSTAWRLVRLVNRIAIILTLGRVFETVNRAIAAGLALSVVSKSVFALTVAIILAWGLQSIRPDERQVPSAPAMPERRPVWIVVARMAAWFAILGTVLAAIFGYPALAAFLSEQIETLTILASLTFLALRISNEVFDQLVSPHTRLFRSIQSASGLPRQSLEQLAVILSGLVQLLILGFALTFALAPWRVDSGDILMPLKAVFFGFTIGDVTISFGAAFFALILFGAGILFTRGVQRWLTQTYLPHTHLDAGLRNSIVTGIGYLGVIVAVALGSSALGFSLEKVTIVAGALSVGIGFGLQSIVNNFVSGLILLWERGIRVGDWIVVGDEQGYVKRINVRATEIETFDRSVLIVPNSSLVSGAVKNRVHNDRTGRVLVLVPVPRDADPDLVARLIEEAAKEHRDVLAEPPPKAFFRRIGENTKDFELVCFVADVDQAGHVGSDLLFLIDRSLRANGLGEIVPRMLVVQSEDALKPTKT